MKKTTLLAALTAIIALSLISCTPKTKRGQIYVIGEEEADYAQIEGMIIDSNFIPLSGVIRFTTSSGDEVIEVTNGRFSGKMGEQNVSKLSFKGSNYDFQEKFKAKINQKLKIIVVYYK